jgi:hypothetical protein|tara:strand:- start:1904 stop:2491 length:588 start_codon:yes stop_codon:yes gene_type:complete
MFKQQKENKMKTETIIYKMLTENTGVHLCDSGGDNDRHWQRNQKKSIKDFRNESYTSNDDGFITKSLFHHLNESLEYLPSETNMFNAWIKADKYDWVKNPDGRCHIINDVQNFMDTYIYPETESQCTYTYNFENCLSQDIQYISSGDLYENNIIALCIHNGCDARGGMTDYKFFKVDVDSFYNWDDEIYKEDEVA